MECLKIKFETQEDAEAELRRIVEGNDWRSWKRKSCSRLYLCKYCEGYHLTSSKYVTEYKKEIP